MIYNVIDLFAGAGGLSLGFKQTGQVKIVAAAENNLNARKTYKRNFKLARLYSETMPNCKIPLDLLILLLAVRHVRGSRMQIVNTLR